MTSTNKLALVAVEPDGLVRAAAEGAITGADARAGVNLFESLLGANWAQSRVLLDMARLDYIDSAAIGWLIESQKHFRQNGGGLALFRVVPRVRQMLTMLKLDQLLNIHPDESAARAALPPPKAQPAGGASSTEAGT